MKWFSLFSGIGGFDLALKNLGHETVGACEIDEHARTIYKRHFPKVPVWMDARSIVPEDLPEFDGLCAGFPCQAFSVAGRRLGLEESRGTLFFEIARIAKQVRPKLLFLENVKGLLFHDRGKTISIILSTLDELGYDIEWQVINSKHFVPQNRERIFIIGHLRGGRSKQVFPLGEIGEIPDSPQGETQETGSRLRSRHSRAIQSTPNKGTSTYIKTIDFNYWKGPPHGSMIKVGNIDTKGHNSIWGRVYDPKGISQTINAEGGGLGAKTGLYAISHTKANMKQRFQERHDTWTLDTTGSKMAIDSKDKIRRLTPLECERLQGFPDQWTAGISDTQRYKCIGNAVTVPVVEFIAKALVA